MHVTRALRLNLFVTPPALFACPLEWVLMLDLHNILILPVGFCSFLFTGMLW
jgi:hypothetical protein